MSELVVFAPFATAIAIVWIVLHYRSQRRREREASAGVQRRSEHELNALAESMEKRIQALEQILDAEAPGWRKKHEHA